VVLCLVYKRLISSNLPHFKKEVARKIVAVFFERVASMLKGVALLEVKRGYVSSALLLCSDNIEELRSSS